MAKITIPFQDSAPEQALLSNINDAAGLGRIAQSTTQSLDQMLNNQLQTADDERRNAFRAEQQAVDARNKADLSKVIPAAMKEVGSVIDETTNKIAQLDQSQYNQELKKQEAAYMVYELSDFQENYGKMLQSHKGGKSSPQEMTNWVNDQMVNILGKAPSEDAKLNMTEKLLHYRMDALAKGYASSKRAATSTQVDQLTKAMKQSANKAKADPLNPMAYINEIMHIGDVMEKTQGLSVDSKNKLVDSFKADVIKQSVVSLNQKDQPTQGLNLLSEAQRLNLAPANVIQELTDETAKTSLALHIQSDGNMKNAIGLRAFATGKLNSNVEGAGKYADLGFLAFKSQMPPSESLDQNNYLDYSRGLQSFFSNHNKVIGPDSLSFLVNNVVDTNNPHGAAATSLFLDSVLNSKDPNLQELAPQLVKNKDIDAAKLTSALDLAKLVNLGIPPQEAFARVKANYLDKSSASQLEDKNINSKLVKAWGDNKKLLEPEVAEIFGVDHFWSSTPINLTKMSAEYEDNVRTFTKYNGGDVESAKTLAKARLRDNYGVTEVNGKSEIMQFPPEKFTNDPRVARNLIGQQLNAVADLIGMTNYNPKTKVGELNGDKVPIGIQPIHNYTNNNKAVKEYAVVDLRTNSFILDKERQIKTIKLQVNPDTYKNELDMLKSTYEKAGLAWRTDSQLKEDHISELQKQFPNLIIGK